MKILYLTLEPPFDETLVARGNAIRAATMMRSLEGRGHEVVHAWRAANEAEKSPKMAKSPKNTAAYRGADELRELIGQTVPDGVIAGYWNLVAELPDDFHNPVVIDFIAPRMLEALFEDPAIHDTGTRDLLRALGRAGGFVVANARQKHLLIPYLLMAGHDLREHMPVAEVPITRGPPPPAATPPAGQITFVGGGVDWPWRRQRRWLEALADEVRGHSPSARFVEFGGRYPGVADRPDGGVRVPDDPVSRVDLASFADYSRFLSAHAHVGVELADENVERYFSQSFRVVDFLSHGLPVICNRYLSIADRIERYDAGWLVAGVEEIPDLIRRIVSAPGDWAPKSANALELVRREFDPDRAVEPLCNLLDELKQNAYRRPGREFSALAEEEREELERLRPAVGDSGGTSLAGSATLGDLRRQIAGLHERNRQLSVRIQGKKRPRARSVLRQAFREVVRKLPKPAAQGPPGNVVMVTRSDLYPTDHGAAVKIVETARGLSARGHEVGIVTDRRDVWWHYRNGELQTRRFPRWLGWISLPPGMSSLFHQSGDFPLSNSFLYLPLSDIGFTWRALHVARRLHANVYQAEFPAYAQPCLRVRSVRGGRVVLVEHNVEYERIREQNPDLTEDQHALLKEVEIGLCNLSDAVVCVSENDRRRLSGDGVSEHLLHHIPHGVDLAGYETAEARDLRREFGWDASTTLLVYHGTYEYPPNLEAVKLCARELLPRLEKRGLDVRLVAIGARPPAEPIHPHVRFTGTTSSIAEWLKAADIAVVPLTSGGGTRMKIIDYFACGVPVVATSKGIEGIPAQSGYEAFVEDDWDRFCDRVEALARDSALRSRMAAAARSFAAPLDWSALAGRYVSLFNRL